MTDTPDNQGTWTTTTTDVTYNVDSDVVAEAVKNAVAASEPRPVGDHGLLQLIPPGWSVHVLDDRTNEDFPRERAGDFRFTDVGSLGGYVNRYRTAHSIGYVRDPNGIGVSTLVHDHDAISVILDDHPAPVHPIRIIVNDPSSAVYPDGDDGPVAANRKHRAVLVLRPTAAARRWGTALQGTIDQEQLLDLVVDGIGEIAVPPGAELRDLISDLHAVRNTSAHHVIRAAGATTVELAENVTLHAGPGNRVTIPETVTLVFQPWTAVAQLITVVARVKPKVSDRGRITFTLTAPDLDAQLVAVVGQAVEMLGDLTSGGDADDTGLPLFTVP